MKDGIEQKKTEGRETRVKEAALTAMIKEVIRRAARTSVLPYGYICASIL